MTTAARPHRDGAGAAASRRVVLLGASNLTGSLGRVVTTAGRLLGGPLEVLAACGYGRSYGTTSRVLVRQLPGIVECRLWSDLRRGGARSTAALVTDIGNDILYEQPVERIAGWVEACLDRLAAAGAETVVTLLPVDNLPAMSAARFYFFRTLLVPGCRLDFDQIVERVAALDQRVNKLAVERGFTTVRPRRRWYGLDPIHIRWSQRRAAWSEILDPWSPEAAHRAASGGWWRSLYLGTRTPARRRLFGYEQRGRLPSARFADGTTIALY